MENGETLRAKSPGRHDGGMDQERGDHGNGRDRGDPADRGSSGSGRVRRPVVRIPVEPVEAAVEADAVDAAVRASDVAVRGPVFGVAAQCLKDTEDVWGSEGAEDSEDMGGSEGTGSSTEHAGEMTAAQRWRVVTPVTAACPQLARDSLNSLLWFQAKDDARNAAERRSLLTAVARLERERVDEITVLDHRYRIVRAEEYAGTGPDGIELPRPTDPEPVAPDWEFGTKGPKIDDGLVLDPDAPVTPAQAAEMLALRGLRYTGDRFPREVRDDSRRALDSHPDVLLLPATFTLVERSGAGWTPSGVPHSTAHEARKTLDFTLMWWKPRLRGLVPLGPVRVDREGEDEEGKDRDGKNGDEKGGDGRDEEKSAGERSTAGRFIDARALLAGGDLTPETATEMAAYVAASERLRGGRVDQLDVLGTSYRIARTRRLLRWGPDGPEGPRPSDTNSQDPGRIHPPLDEDGNVVIQDEEDEDQELA